jgi:hypothetical protein
MAEPLEYHEREQAIPASKERAVMRAQMFDQAGGAMGFEVKARRVFRHGPTATVVRQLLFWEGRKCADPEGYVYITYPQWWDEEGLTRTNVDTARHKLKDAGVLEEDRRGVFNRLHYRLKLGRLMEVMFPELDPPAENDPVPENEANLNQDFTVQGSDGLECRVPAVQSAGMRPSHDKEHTESTSKEVSPLSPPRGADREGKEEKAGSVRGPSDTSSLDAKREPTQNRAGEERAKERSPRKRKRSRAGTVQTPEAGLQALRDHRDRLGGTLKGYVPVAKRWDFTQDNPPWWVMKELDNDYRLLDRVERIVRGGVREAEVNEVNAKKLRGHDHPSLTSPSGRSDTPPGDRTRAEDGPSLTGTRKPNPNSLEAILAAEKAQKAEDAELLKAYRKAHPEDFVLKPGDLDF